MDANGLVAAGRVQSLELNRLFSLMDGIQADDLFAGMADQLPSIVLPPLPQPGAGCGAEHPSASVGAPNGSAAGAGAFAGAISSGLEDEGEGQTSGGSAAPVPAQPADKPQPQKALYRIHQPPVIERGTCTKICPASSAHPKYKFVVPNEFVAQHMAHLVERPFRLINGRGGGWDCTLIQRRNKDKHEYMIQGWRRYGEEARISEGDTVQLGMVGPDTMQVAIIRRGKAARFRGLVQVQAPLGDLGSGGGGGGGGGDGRAGGLAAGGSGMVQTRSADEALGLASAAKQRQQQQHSLPVDDAAAANRLATLPADLLAAVLKRHQDVAASLGMAPAPSSSGGPGLGLMAGAQGPGASPASALPPDEQLALMQQQVAALASSGLLPQHSSGAAAQPAPKPSVLELPMLAQRGDGGLASAFEPAAKRHRVAPELLQAGLPLISDLAPALQQAAPQPLCAPMPAAAMQLPLSSSLCSLDPPVSLGDAGGVPAAQPLQPRGDSEGRGVMESMSDFDALLQENMALREELRLAQAKVATLESGVLGIKAVLARNSDPGLAAVTVGGVLNHINLIELADFLPELSAEGRAALAAICADIRCHLSSVVKMCWLLREAASC